MTTADQAAKGFAVPCIKCGVEGNILVALFDVETFHCNECDEDFTADEVREAVDGWRRVLAWIDAVPAPGGP